MEHPQQENVVYAAVTSGELEIDETGRVWRVKKRWRNRWTGRIECSPCRRVRAEAGKEGGYLQVRVMWNGKRACAAAHRLVWLHMNGPIPQGITINHCDGAKSNNHPRNLELATYSQQRLHAVRVLGARHADVKGSRHPKTFLTDVQVMEMRRMRKTGAMVKDLATRFGMNAKAVSAICTGRNWPHLPMP